MNAAMDIDLARARADTPGVRHVLHLNNAGAALTPKPVISAVAEHLDLEARIGGYEAAEVSGPAIEACYDALANLLGCTRDEIAIVDSATRAWDMAFYAQRLGRGDRILTSSSEYSSNFIAFLHVARRVGASVHVVPDDETGQLSVRALEEMISPEVKLIAVTHVPTSGGLVNPAAAIGRVARQAGVPFLLDACQSCGQMPIDVKAIGCDMLSGTGRKYLRGPRGTAFLYVRKALLAQMDPPFLDDHAATWTARDAYVVRDDARRFETWESNVAGRIGLGVAVNYALGLGLDAIARRVDMLAARTREGLEDISGVTVHDQGAQKCGIVTFTAKGVASDDLKRDLRSRAINVTVSSRESTLIDMTTRGLGQIVRASPHYYNSEEEIEDFIGALAQIMHRRAA